MADPADIANDKADADLARALKAGLGKSFAESHPDFDGTCLDCGGEIHPGRLELGRIRCLGCQQELELRARLGTTHS